MGSKPAVTVLMLTHIHIGDKVSTLCQVLLVEHSYNWHRHEVRIPDVEPTIGESQPAGLGEQVHHLFTERIPAEVEVLENAQDLTDGQRAGRGWTHTVDVVASVLDAYRRAFDDFVVG